MELIRKLMRPWDRKSIGMFWFGTGLALAVAIALQLRTALFEDPYPIPMVEIASVVLMMAGIALVASVRARPKGKPGERHVNL